MIYRFGSYELDEAAGELRRNGEPVPLQPKPLALLTLLVRERARVVPLEELFERLWPGTAVTPASLTRAVSHARKAIGDTNRGRLIRSHARRGYRFCGDVVVVAPPAPAEASAAASPRQEIPGTSSSRDAFVPLTESLFVGRGDALARLAEAEARAARGRSTLALVSGPAGIGKTRLVETFAENASTRGPRLITARAREGEGVPAFWLWAQVLRQLVSDPQLRDHLGELAARPGPLAALVPDLATLAPGLSAPAAGSARGPAAVASSDLSADQSRFLLFDAITRTLDRCSRERPLVLVLEDLQWAGPPSLRLLEHLLFEARDARLLVVATIRDEPRDRGHPLDRTLSVLRSLDRCVRIELPAFSRGEVASLLANVLGAPAPSDLTSELYARTEGVPLFVREAIRLLRDRGELRHPERIARRGVQLPDHAVDFIRRGLDSLSADCAALVGAGAVVGREFALPLVASATRVDREAALDLLDEATDKGVLEALTESAATYRFTHALFQEAAYGALPGGVRARLHLRVARRLEEQHADDPDRVIAELAHHHLRSIAVGDPERAYQCAVRAAERAASVCAYEEAASHHEQALTALEHGEAVDPERRLETLLALAEAQRVAGERDRRREVSREAASSARAQGRPVALARAAIGFCDISEWSPRDEEAEAVLREALAALESSAVAGQEHLVLRARILARIAYLRNAALRSGLPEDDQARTIALARQAMELARRAGDPEALQEAGYILHYVVAGPEGHEERCRLAEEVAEAAARAGTHEVTIIELLDLACDRLALGDRTGADGYRARAGRVAGDAPTPSATWHMGVYDTGVALLEGRFAEAESAARDTLSVGRRIAHPVALGCYNAHRVRLAQECGDHEEVVRLFEPVLRRPEHPIAWVRSVVARAQLRLGEEASARGHFEELAAHGFADVPRGIRWAITMAELASLCADLADERRAPLVLEAVERFEHHHGVLPVLVCYGGPLAWPLARLRQLLGEDDEARRLYEAALDSAGALGARPALARIALDLAGLLERGGEGERAASLRRRSHALAEELGMAEVAGKAPHPAAPDGAGGVQTAPGGDVRPG